MIIKEFLQSLNTELIVNIILFLAGLVIGNWLAIGRDKRKEFNEIADEVYLALKQQKERIKESSAVVNGPKESDFVKLKRRISIFKTKSFEKSLNHYKDAATSSVNWKQDATGQPFYKDSKKVIQSINDLIEFTNRK